LTNIPWYVIIYSWSGQKPTSNNGWFPTAKEIFIMNANGKQVGYWFAGDSIKVIQLDGLYLALDGWNGEKYTECWRCAYPGKGIYTFTEKVQSDDRTYEVVPIEEDELDEDGELTQVRIVGYKIV
jgi:hypothetical protein